MTRHSILRITAKFMIPYILLFALYVQFHGDFGPGGGFQAGVIFAAGFILYGLIFGMDNANNFLDYSVLLKNSVSGQHLGIFLVELGVGITVSATMITIFYVFASQDK